MLWWGKDSLPIHALVDSAANGNFIDQNVVSQLGIPVLPLEEPRDVLAIDGKFLVKVSHMTIHAHTDSFWQPS